MRRDEDVHVEIEGVVHRVTWSGAFGGTTRCLTRFRWKGRLARSMEPVGELVPLVVTCMCCLEGDGYDNDDDAD